MSSCRKHCTEFLYTPEKDPPWRLYTPLSLLYLSDSLQYSHKMRASACRWHVGYCSTDLCWFSLWSGPEADNQITVCACVWCVLHSRWSVFSSAPASFPSLLYSACLCNSTHMYDHWITWLVLDRGWWHILVIRQRLIHPNPLHLLIQGFDSLRDTDIFLAWTGTEKQKQKHKDMTDADFWIACIYVS